ncbi:recombinase family protein [Paenibacillus sp. MBLB4367]|uniref:recombinase family protein n=1 Tax=Paenibacillus sp. MBLB4367 TaxID=3384767 RepID=UPI003908069C
MERTYDIRDVALYLRKSRGELESDLDKHRMLLTGLCKNGGWRFIEYLEIASSETIEFRPKFSQLLKDVQADMFDAVLVVDYDRLGRGDLEDQAVIKRIFRESETLVITPDKAYNLSDDSDDLLVDVKGLLARQEYKAIKRRLSRGKKIGARLGNWTNGTAPFPYLYDPSRKGLIVDPVNNEIYQEMKRLIIEEGYSNERVAWYLNNKEVKSARGSVWHENQVRRLIIDETHLGRIISNKTEGSGHKNKKTKPLRKLPREEWVIVENCHEAVKTIDEHNRLLEIFASRRIIPTAARKGKHLLSGIVKCGICGYVIGLYSRNTENGASYVKPCRKASPYGVKCTNSGIEISILLDVVYHDLKDYEQKLISDNPSTNREQSKLSEKLDMTEHDLVKKQSGIQRAKDLYIDGDISKDEYESRKNRIEQDISRLQEEIEQLKAALHIRENRTREESLHKVKSLLSIWNDNGVGSEIKNHLARDVIEKISYNRNGDNVKINVHYIS